MILNINDMKKQLFLMLVVLYSLNVEAQTSKRSIEVVGKATVKTIPEEVIFRIPLKIVDSSYLNCSDAISKTLNNLKKELSSKGIAENNISTSNYSINENMVYDGGKRKQQGYKASVTVMVSEIYDELFVQKVLQSIEKYELTYAVNFTLSLSQKEELTKIAMTKAVEDAKRKAIILTMASEVELADIMSISYGKDVYRAEPIHNERMLSSKADIVNSEDLSLSPRQTSLFKSVLIVWEIK